MMMQTYGDAKKILKKQRDYTDDKAKYLY